MSTQNNSIQRILLVDDNPDDRLLVIRELSREFSQVRVIEIIDTSALNQALAADKFDLVITDYQLNWTTGLEVLRAVKSRDRNCPVIMFTNTGSQEIAVEAMKAGLDDYVIKSTKHFTRLTQAIRSVWQQSQTSRKAAQLELRLQSLLNQLRIGVFRATPKAKILDVNTAFLNILGLPSLEEVQSFICEQQLYSFMTNERQFGKEWEREIHLQRPDGKNIWVLFNETLNQLDGETFIDGLVEDITQRKQSEAEILQFNQTLERRVQERTAELEAINSELEAFAYSVSHDLRSPIRQIDGFVHLLKEHLETTTSDETSLHYLQAILELTHRAGELVDDLLSYSRTGRAEMHYSIVDMNRLVWEAKQQTEMLFPDRQIIWYLQQLPHVWGDRSLLRLVWQNLIENAVKFTQPCHQPVITIGSIEDEQETIFFIQDNGVGFDMRYVNRLFGIFQRLHNETQFEGTGIGLANIQRIIHRHHGKVWAEGVINQGAKIYFTLPKVNI
ncbi:MAG: hybrid sensor histidine kinase/response regulator [Hapalosiphonaceae cyanobacterium JJU2]|nr:MAG: hybrid sensor histidine kinase/response regulator [Hapalosiphonaceae cyanobacterium JJU2]